MEEAIIEAETKAWEALARYKFHMFGYWSAIWVHLNKISGEKRPNPWKKLVDIAKKEVTAKVIFTGTAAELIPFLAKHPEAQKKNIKIIPKEKEAPT
ncbi:hypothetical protein LCGC14_1206320 [marine sediment metagenome]|uniref:Uncharacterized protein n=1 Tax=marine sediment metagenome TaxID=412755 RepID=A0A0F9NXM4_9ZZZZ